MSPWRRPITPRKLLWRTLTPFPHEVAPHMPTLVISPWRGPLEDAPRGHPLRILPEYPFPLGKRPSQRCFPGGCLPPQPTNLKSLSSTVRECSPPP